MRAVAIVAAGSLAAGFSLSTPLQASARPLYVGTWALSAAACKLPSDTLDAPVVMAAKSYDQFETHCAFGAVTRKNGSWHTPVNCLVEGAVQRDRLTIWASAKRLTIRWGAFKKGFNYVRCS
jgi:hypothetical protein